MKTNDLIAALQETLAKYQQNGTKEEDSTQRLEAQLAELKADVTQLQSSLQAAQEEKLLLLKTLREQSQQLLTLTQHVATGSPVTAPEVGAVEAASAVLATESLPVEADMEKTPKTTSTKKSKTPSAKAKTTPTKAPTTAKPVEAKAEEKPAKKEVKAAAKEAPAVVKAVPTTPSLDQLWDMVRAFNAGKPLPQRIRFDEHLAVNYFGFKSSEWTDWYKGTNSAKVKRQPSQVRTNQRKAAKEGIDLLKQQWNATFPSAPVTAEESVKSEVLTSEEPSASVAEPPSEAKAVPAVSEATTVTAPETQVQTTNQKTSTQKPGKATQKATKPSVSKKINKADSPKKADPSSKQADPSSKQVDTPSKQADTPSKKADKKATSSKKASAKSDKPQAEPPVPAEMNGQKAMQELFEFFQSWNQKAENASIRFTPHTAASFDNIELDQARGWIDEHQSEVTLLNEGVPPNNRREARQALEQLKATWSLL